jgi:NADP-dependent 3-hydroxy acid dehydrogenase YdfG
MRAELQNMNKQGSIVNASSIAGIIGFPKHSAYTAAKHGELHPGIFLSATTNNY